MSFKRVQSVDEFVAFVLGDRGAGSSDPAPELLRFKSIVSNLQSHPQNGRVWPRFLMRWSGTLKR